jgi:hypothetical protein
MVWDSVANGLCQNCDQQIEQIEGLIYVVCGRMWQSLDVSSDLALETPNLYRSWEECATLLSIDK